VEYDTDDLSCAQTDTESFWIHVAGIESYAHDEADNHPEKAGTLC